MLRAPIPFLEARYTSQTRALVEIRPTDGTLTYSLPQEAGRTVHRYVHRSACDEHDHANTGEATDKNAPTVGRSFSVSIPVDPARPTVTNSTTVLEDDGSTTRYCWTLTRRP